MTPHIVFSAVFISQHRHRFLLNEIAIIGDDAGLRNNHVDNACKNEGVAE